MTSDTPRIKELDGLRAIAITMVVAWHYLGITGGDGSLQWRALWIGQSGVDLFFVLSGYLISGILLRGKKTANYFSTFYLRRAFRILPIYFGMVALYVAGRQSGIFPYLFSGQIPTWTYVAGVQNFWMAALDTYGAPWLGATWSLAIEEEFYLLFPLVGYLISPRTLFRVLIAILLLCPIARIFARDIGYGTYVLMPLRADILAVGALIALLQYTDAVTELVRRIVRIAFLLSAGFFPIFAWMIAPTNEGMAIWGHTYLVVLYGAALFLAIDGAGSPRLTWLRSRPAAAIAQISYALYLVHGPVLITTFAAVRSAPTQSHPAGYLLIAAATTVSIALCWLSYRLIENPLIRVAHERFRYAPSLSTSPT